MLELATTSLRGVRLIASHASRRRAFCCERSVPSTTITAAPPLNCPSVILSFIHSVCPTRIYDKIYKLFMSIYPPGGRYVYVFTIQYASSSQKKNKFKFGTLVHNFGKKILVHNFGILAQNFGTLAQNFGTLV